MNNKQRRFRNILSAVVLVILSVSTFFILPSTFKAYATPSAPIFGGWGGTMLKDTNPNATAPLSSAYPNETQSNFEQELLKQIGYGYNAIRVSFAPFCGLKYHLSYGGGLETNFMGDFSGFQLARAVHIAQYYNSYLAVDYHGYSDFQNSTTINCVANFWTQNITIPYENGYANLIWEILNEHNLPGLNDQQATTATSTGYQTVLNAIRSNGDTHWVAVGNVCSFGCGRTVDQYYLDYPNVNDTATQHVFEDLHTYIGYNNTAYGTGYCGTVNNLTACSTLWTNSTADKITRSYYIDFLNQSPFTSHPACPNISPDSAT